LEYSSYLTISGDGEDGTACELCRRQERKHKMSATLTGLHAAAALLPLLIPVAAMVLAMAAALRANAKLLSAPRLTRRS
jgi:hypothetical protein